MYSFDLLNMFRSLACMGFKKKKLSFKVNKQTQIFYFPF